MNPGIHPTRRRRGFSLVITIAMMVLLSLLAVGLLSLSTISLRSASSQKWLQQARHNARMALVLAIGDLQQATGPDQRVTAPGSIRGESVARPHLTGVWDGWRWDGSGPAPDYDQQKQASFQRWLVSSPDPADARSMSLVESAPGGPVVELVGGHRDPADRVLASRVDIDLGNTGTREGFAWAVFDESTKLPLALPEPEHRGVPSAVAAMSAAPLPGYAAATGRAWEPLADADDTRLKLVTEAEAALIGLSADDRGFHDVTSRTAAPLANVAEGGLAVDLSRLMDSPDGLPEEFSQRHLYSDADSPLVAAPERFRGANPLPSPDPSWRLLHSHYQLYNALGGGAAPSLDCLADPRPSAGTPANRAEGNRFFHGQQIAPSIAKAQFVFSLSFGWHGSLNGAAASNNSSLPAGRRDEFVTWLVVDPVITLWNPYNVNLRFTGGRIDLYRVPLAFRLYKNGQLINSEYTHFANTFVSGDFGSRSDNYYRLNLLPEQGERELVMAPGEHIVFTAHNHVKHYLHEYMNVGLDLRPGFAPPAGNQSAGDVGGTSSMNVCVNASGSPSGRAYGKTVRTVAVKPGDRIQVEVKSMRASVDKPSETGGREVSGFLKYYTSRRGRDQLVGGIELDYGDDETEYLPSFTARDLPTLIVSNDIPRNVKADDYQGRTPPVACRFKEPFVISTFQLKTERDSKFPGRGWLHNSPTNLYASAGIDQPEPWSMHQYELQWEVMSDWPPSSPTIEISTTGNRGYGGPGIYAQTGVEFATFRSVPLAPALSIPQFRHAPLNAGGQLPLTSQVVANSFAPPLLAADQVRSEADGRSYLDHSWHANQALFDRTFLSGIATPGGPAGSTRGLRQALDAFLAGEQPLPQARLVPFAGNRAAPEAAEEVTGEEGWRRSAAYLLVDAPFNVNGTNVDVWEALLASTFNAELPVITGGALDTAADENVAATRHLASPGLAVETQGGPLAYDLAKWNGHRRLPPEDIRRLAEEIVEEVRNRGPFQSLAEFVNRRPEAGELGRSGALQAAIDRAGINDPVLDPGFAVVVEGALNPDAAEGNTADGAPAVLTQADLLTPLAPVLTARGDTFRIRAYGEAGPEAGQVTRVWCEAVVQRVPEYLAAAADEPWDQPEDPANRRFGRRYDLVSFRWLSPEEV